MFKNLIAQVYAQQDPIINLSETKLPKFPLGQLFTNLIIFVSVIAAVAAFIGIVYSGYLWITSGGIPAQGAKARNGLTWSIAGFLVAIFAYVIVRFVFGIGSDIAP